MALRNHLIHVDELIELQDSRLRGLREEFERDVSIIKAELDGEKFEIERSHNQEKQELLDMIETIKETELGKLDEMKQAFESSREETKNKNVEDLETMKQDLIKKIQELDTDFENNFQQFMTETNTKATKYDELLKENTKNTDMIT